MAMGTHCNYILRFGGKRRIGFDRMAPTQRAHPGRRSRATLWPFQRECSKELAAPKLLLVFHLAQKAQASRNNLPGRCGLCLRGT